MTAMQLMKPRRDDRIVCDLVDRVVGSFAVIIAHEAGVFRALAAGPRTAQELSAALGLERRACEALLILCTSADLLWIEDGRYGLTCIAEDYFLESSPTYAGALFELHSRDDSPFSFHQLRESILGQPEWVHGKRAWVETNRKDATRAAAFTRAMHGHSMGAALAWPEQIDLRESRRMLDVGGGSGAHSIGAAMRWPQLEAVILDLPAVCIAAEDYVRHYQLMHRITTHAADMWHDPWPRADVHFFGDIFHDWTHEECRTLARRSYDALESGGRILVHETLLDDDKRGPFTVAASSLAMLAFCGGQQFSRIELISLLQDAGFQELAVIPTFGYWSVVAGRKR